MQISAYIAICMKRQAKAEKRNPEWEEMCAVAAAAQNMWLMATALGVHGYWSSWQEAARTSSLMKEFLGLEEEDMCLGIFSVGVSDRASSYRGSRSPFTDKITWKY